MLSIDYTLHKTITLALECLAPCHTIDDFTQIDARHVTLECQLPHGFLQLPNQYIAHVSNLVQFHAPPIIKNCLHVLQPMDVGWGLIQLVEILPYSQLTQNASYRRK
jgi:hypothetical protein